MSNEADKTRLKVPVGLRSDGRIVKPAEVGVGEVVVCPGCGIGLLVRGGEGRRVRRHFAHRAEAPCSQESVLHKAAKGLVAQVLRDWLDGRGAPVVVHGVCARAHCGAAWSRELRRTADAVVVEHRLLSGRVADVALLRDERAVAVVEIHVSHAVDDEKALALGGIPCAELEAWDVMNDPVQWRPRPDRARPRSCPSCDREELRLRRAGVPPWVEQLRDGTETRSTVERWRRDIRFVKRRKEHVLFDVVIARLSRDVDAREWEEWKRGRSARTRRQREAFPDLPEHIRHYWEVESALQEFGGEWLTPAEGDWQLALEAAKRRRNAADPNEDRWARILRVGRATGQWVPPGRSSPYWVEPYFCHADSCGQEMLVYSWKGHMWMTDWEPPPPRPATVQLHETKRAGGMYWANVCPACDRVQGENFIYQPNGPLPRRLAGDAYEREGSWDPFARAFGGFVPFGSPK